MCFLVFYAFFTRVYVFSVDYFVFVSKKCFLLITFFLFMCFCSGIFVCFTPEICDVINHPTCFSVLCGFYVLFHAIFVFFVDIYMIVFCIRCTVCLTRYESHEKHTKFEGTTMDFVFERVLDPLKKQGVSPCVRRWTYMCVGWVVLMR